MRLNVNNIQHIQPHIPLTSRPERVIQFGTGVLLRALPDYYIDQANKSNVFNGSIAVVKSTQQGSLDAFRDQDNLYTLLVQGFQQAKIVREEYVISSISRVLSAVEEWDSILEIAKDRRVQIVISNTTEAGILEVEDGPLFPTPKSFPGRLTAFLHHRFLHFEGDPDMGMIILPTELINKNGDTLRGTILNLSRRHDLSEDFTDWILQHNHFCNTLVDRIVPGKTESLSLAYEDDLAIMAEPFHLWAIESSSDRIQEILSFAGEATGPGIVDSIEHFKEIKLRLLNGTHTLTCGRALLAGHEFVRQTLADSAHEDWVGRLINDEIIPYLRHQNIKERDIQDFALSVIDRFRNPFLDHKWISIAQNYTSKVRQRILPILKDWYSWHENDPQHIAMGLAGYISLMNTTAVNGTYIRQTENIKLVVEDPFAKNLYLHWQTSDPVKSILADSSLWDEDLSLYGTLVDTIRKFI